MMQQWSAPAGHVWLDRLPASLKVVPPGHPAGLFFRLLMSPLLSVRRTTGRAEFILLMGALMALNSIAIDVVLPALPAMGRALGVVSDNERQLVISAYLFGFGAVQLLVGPLADRFGRRKPLLIGIALYVVTAALAPFSPTLAILLALRFVQGAGAAGTRVLAQAIVRDRHSGRDMAEVLALANMVFMILPVVAPGIGQIILAIGTWQDIFGFMVVLGALIGGWIWLRLPETLAPANRRVFTLSGVAEGFRIVGSNRTALAYGLAGMFLFGALLGFINSAQQIYVDIYGLGVLFPLAFAGVAALQSGAAFINARMVRRLGTHYVAHFAVLAYVALSAVLLVTSLLTPLSFAAFFALLAAIMCMFTWSGSNANALSMEPLGRVAGTASSAFGFIQTIGGTLLGMLIGQAYDGTVTPVGFGYFLMGSGALAAVLIAERGRLFHERPAAAE